MKRLSVFALFLILLNIVNISSAYAVTNTASSSVEIELSTPNSDVFESDYFMADTTTTANTFTTITISVILQGNLDAGGLRLYKTLIMIWFL